MPRIQVLLDESGDVVGTAEESQQATGDGAQRHASYPATVRP